MKGNGSKPLVLITGHRRESFGPAFESICKAIGALASEFPQTAFVYPVHLNPNVRQPVFDLLGSVENVFLLEPLGYLDFRFASIYWRTKRSSLAAWQDRFQARPSAIATEARDG